MSYIFGQTFKKVARSAYTGFFGGAAVITVALLTMEPLNRFPNLSIMGQGTADIPPDLIQEQTFPQAVPQYSESSSSDHGMAAALQKLIRQRKIYEAELQELRQKKRALGEAALQELLEKRANYQAELQHKRNKKKVVRAAALQELIEKRANYHAALQHKQKAAHEAAVQEQIEKRSAREAANPRGMPIYRAGISAEFGTRWNPFGEGKDFHAGIDLVGPHGSPIYVTAPGTVKRARYNRRNGNYVVVDHGHGYKTLYAHLSRSVVRRHMKVQRGQLLGYMGSTGRSTGPHLHYGIYKRGKPIDPYAFIYGQDRPTIAEATYACGRLIPNSIQATAAIRMSIVRNQKCPQQLQSKTLN